MFYIVKDNFRLSLWLTQILDSTIQKAKTVMHPQGPWNAQQWQFNNNYRSEQVYQLVMKLTGPSLAERAEALHQLSLQREHIPNLAVYLWESPATITSLLSEILSVYPHLAATSTASNTTPPSLSLRLAQRVLNVLTLFQCVAAHSEIRTQFIRADIPMYLFPFLHTTNKSRECECFKLTSLGIIGSLVRSEQPDRGQSKSEPTVITYLLQNEFVPLCLRILKFGQELPRIVAAFIVQKILSDPGGLKSVCESAEKLETVVKVLNIVLCDLALSYNERLAKNVLGSYECLLQVKEAQDLVARADLGKLKQVQLCPECPPKFVEFIERLRQRSV